MSTVTEHYMRGAKVARYLQALEDITKENPMLAENLADLFIKDELSREAMGIWQVMACAKPLSDASAATLKGLLDERGYS